MSWPSTDPSFVSAVETRYLAEARRLIGASAASELHEAALAAAIYKADPTNGGLRYRALSVAMRSELDERLRRFDPSSHAYVCLARHQ